jgi:MFS family permease
LAAVSAIALLILPLWDTLWLGLPCLALVGFGSTGSAVLSQTLVQVEVEDRIRGRVSSLWGMASLGGAAFGGLILGGLLHSLGLVAASILSAVVALLIPLAALAMIRRGRGSIVGRRVPVAPEPDFKSLP